MSYRTSNSGLSYKLILISLVVLLWALIYLPGLGILEFQGTENKRAEPPMRMIETGDFIVPSLAGETYLSKPPLIYWIISLSYLTTGNHSEWAARVPSTLAVLAFVLIVMSTGKSFMPVDARFLISVVFLTTFGIISKGRECEIEALYTALGGISLWIWINYSEELPSSWMTGLIIGIFLGLGLLSKGPLILLFFYLPVFFYLFKERRKNELWSLGYIILIATALLLFISWAAQVYQKIPASPEKEVAGGWYEQMATRFNINEFRFGRYSMEVSSSLLSALPWLLFLPFMFSKRIAVNLENRHKFRALLAGTLVSFAIVSLMPDVRARYYIPLLANFCILTGWFLNSQTEEGPFFKIIGKCNIVLASLSAFIILLFTVAVHSGLALKIFSMIDKNYPLSIATPDVKSFIVLSFAAAGIIIACLVSGRQISPRSRHIAMVGFMAGLLMVSYSVYFPPFIKPFEKKREFGRLVNEAVPPNVTIYQYCSEGGVSYQPFNIYIRSPVKHIETDFEVLESPADSYLLIRENFYIGLSSQKDFSERKPVIIRTLPFKKNIYHLIKLK